LVWSTKVLSSFFGCYSRDKKYDLLVDALITGHSHDPGARMQSKVCC